MSGTFQDPPTSDEVTGAIRKPGPESDDPTGEVFALASRKVPLWWLLLSGLGVGSAGVGGGALDMFGLKNLQARVAALELEAVQLRHERELALLRCGCGGHGPISP